MISKSVKRFYDIKRRIAFTLAEVLIVMGIIGLVAEMTIPSLVKNYEKRVTISKLEKQYSSVAQLIKLSEADNGDISLWDWGSTAAPGTNRSFFDTYWAPYLRVSKICTTYADCGYSKDTPWVFPDKTSYNLYVVAVDARTTVILEDGTVLLVVAEVGDGHGGMVTSHCIFVDINGSQPPNVVGKDLFKFLLIPQKGFMPDCYNLSTAVINNNCSPTGTGECCAAKMMKEGWQINDDYPW